MKSFEVTSKFCLGYFPPIPYGVGFLKIKKIGNSERFGLKQMI